MPIGYRETHALERDICVGFFLTYNKFMKKDEIQKDRLCSLDGAVITLPPHNCLNHRISIRSVNNSRILETPEQILKLIGSNTKKFLRCGEELLEKYWALMIVLLADEQDLRNLYFSAINSFLLQ